MVHFQKFGKYEIIRKLGRGLTDVYLAGDAQMNRRVVLKIIEQSRDDLTQLVIEAERRGAVIQEQLHALDSRVLEIYDCGEEDGCFFLSMEYFEGKTLAEILQAERRLEPKRAVRYAAEICSQLRTLHSFVSDVDGRKTAVVHGDIKPSNVQVGAGDELRLLDFGIAKVITFTRNLTHHNLGSPSYCSPERISKAQVDQHADLWAVGITLYEMVSGAPPYQAQNTRKLENLIQSRRPPRALPQSCPASLKAIVAKALASDIERRYASAEAFEDDLRAFLEERPMAAAAERVPAWDANATIEKCPPKPLTGRQSAKSAGPVRGGGWNDLTNVAVALLAGVLAGLLVFIPAGYYYRFWTMSSSLRTSRDYAHEPVQSLSSDWSLYQDLKQRNRFLSELSPVNSIEAPLRANLLASADDIIDSFRNSSDEQLNDFDWSKARLCLSYALEIDPADSKSKGKLALCNGYLNLIQNPPRAAQSMNSFREAESYLPRSADPHLGLARVYVYVSHNIAQALQELHQAEQLGYKPGPKEAEEEADGYLFRAQWELARAKRTPAQARPDRTKWLQMARDDTERARQLYEPLIGFSNVSSNLQQVYEYQSEQIKLQTEYVRYVPLKAHYQRRYPAGSRRWQ
ncbi:MAG: serine/threonine-protein kinase [Bryobacteraceae bacterium]